MTSRRTHDRKEWILYQDGNEIGRVGSSAAASSAISGYEQQRSDYTRDQATKESIAAEERATAASAQTMDLSWEYALRAAERIEEQFPEWREQARESVAEDVPWMNATITREFEGALDSLYPRWRTDIVEAAGDAQADSVQLTDVFRTRIMPKVLDAADGMSAQAILNTSALLRGDIPKDVQDQLLRTRAEFAQQIGSRGQSAGNIVARDLGLTSLQLQEAGLNQSQAALGLGAQAYSIVNQTLQAPVTTGANVTNLMSAYRAPVTDPSAWYQNYIGLISGQGAISANTVLGTAAQVSTQFAQLGQNQAQFSTELGQQSYWNQMNYGLQQQAIQQAGKTDTFGQVMAGLGTLSQAVGSGAAAYAAFSDRRLKRDIEKVGAVCGVNIYKWNYVWGDPGVGVMADEVPWASFMTSSGYLAVDYSKVFRT